MGGGEIIAFNIQGIYEYDCNPYFWGIIREVYLNMYTTSRNIYENLTKIPKSNISNILENNGK